MIPQRYQQQQASMLRACCCAASVFVLTGDGAIDRQLASLNPITGAKIWETAILGVASDTVQRIIKTSTGRLYARRNAKIEEYDISTGNVGTSITTGSNTSTWGIAANGEKINIVFNSGGTIASRRYNADLTLDWSFAHATSTDILGTIYVNPNGVTYWHISGAIDSLSDPLVRSLTNAGALSYLLLSPASQPYPDGYKKQFGFMHGDAVGDYLYVTIFEALPLTFPNKMNLYRINKSDGTFADTNTTCFKTGQDGSTVLHRTNRCANGSVYMPGDYGSNGINISLFRVSLDLATQIATFNSGSQIVAVDSLSNGDVIVTGTTSTTWPGSLGVSANTWCLSNDLATVKWAQLVGTAAYGGLSVASSYRPNS